MKNKQKIREAIFLTIIFFVSTMPLIVNDSSRYIYVFAVISFLALFINRNCSPQKSTCAIKFIFATALFIAFLMFEKYINDYSSSRIRTYVYSLFIIACIGSLSIQREKLYYLLLIAAIYSLFYVTYNNKIDYIHKSQWIVTASTISAITVSIVAISIYDLVNQKNSRYCQLILTIIVLTGILSSLISETRSGWLSLSITSLLILILAREKVISYYKNNQKKIAFFGCISIAIIYTIINDRVLNTFEDIEKIASGEKLDSIGLRIEMWKSAFVIIQGNYLLGLGSDFKNVMFEYANAGEIHPAFLTWHPNHLHNEYLDRFVKQGFLGLSVFFIYIFYCIKLASESQKTMPAVILMVSLLACGLTDRSFELLEVIPFYIVFTFYYLNNHEVDS